SHPCSMAVTRGCVGDLFSVQSDRPGDREEQAGDGFDQLRLAVALHSGHTHDLARLHLEADPVHGTMVAVVDYDQVLDLQHRPARFCGRLLYHQLDGTTDHHLGEFLGRHFAGSRLPYDLAPPEHRDPVGDLEHLPELVGDEDDPLARLAQASDDLEEILDLLRREDRCGFVEDDDLGFAEQDLDDLDPLLETDRQVFDDGARIDLQPVLSRDLGHLLTGLSIVDPSQDIGRLHSEHHVLGDGEDRDQHEVLVDHADAGGDGVAGTVECGRLAVDEDLTLVGFVETVEDVHQG